MKLNDKQMEIMGRSIQKYGARFYMIKIMEELAELTVEVAKNANGGFNMDPLVDEMADVTICLEYLKILQGISEDRVNARIDYKIN